MENAEKNASGKRIFGLETGRLAIRADLGVPSKSSGAVSHKIASQFYFRKA
jgi:hypothetical protein